MQSSRWTSIGREILFSARTELYMNLPFLDSALATLPAADGYDTPTLATDTRVLFFSGAWLAQQYERSRANVNRAYLHTLFHCLLRHPGKTRGRDADLWDLSCDIAVESMLDSLQAKQSDLADAVGAVNHAIATKEEDAGLWRVAFILAQAELFSENGATTGELCAAAEMSEPTMAKKRKLIKELGFLRETRKGRRRFYSLNLQKMG